MENKEMKLNAVEVNDEELENVSGGTTKGQTLICAKCQTVISGVPYLVEGELYCTKCGMN